MLEIRSLLPHLTQAYNLRWSVSQIGPKGKAEAKYRTYREALPDKLYAKHFEGKQAISVQPIMDDGVSCKWGALDIDNYGDPSLSSQVRRTLELFGIPCFVEPSKSNGAHVYFLLEQAVEAKLLRRALRKLAVWIGYPDAELRPAQDSLDVQSGDLGSFMVLPGFGMPEEKVIELLKANTVPLKKFNELTDEGQFIDGPPCLFPVQRKNERAGEWSSRNMYLYQLGVFLKLKHPSDWQDRIRKYNEDVVTPSSPVSEVEALIGQLEKNPRCHYRCKDEPFVSNCNKYACSMRKYGIAAREGAASIISAEGITVLDTDPPLWFVTLNSPVSNETVRVKLTTGQLQNVAQFKKRQLQNVAQFKKRCLEELKVIPTLPSQKEWEAVVSNLLTDVQVIPVPFEMTDHARILDKLYQFCKTAIKSSNPDDLTRGRILTEQTEEGLFIVRFRTTSFIDYLERYTRSKVESAALFNSLNELQRHGKIRAEVVEIPPMKIDVWAMDIESRMLELQLELDMS